MELQVNAVKIVRLTTPQNLPEFPQVWFEPIKRRSLTPRHQSSPVMYAEGTDKKRNLHLTYLRNAN